MTFCHGAYLEPEPPPPPISQWTVQYAVGHAHYAL